ncbi:MAG: hypothetical protein ACYCW6_24850, partial [Candidatus Xenobia bacterium]
MALKECWTGGMAAEDAVRARPCAATLFKQALKGSSARASEPARKRMLHFVYLDLRGFGALGPVL